MHHPDLVTGRCIWGGRLCVACPTGCKDRTTLDVQADEIREALDAGASLDMPSRTTIEGRLVDALADLWADSYRREQGTVQRLDIFRRSAENALYCATGLRLQIQRGGEHERGRRSAT